MAEPEAIAAPVVDLGDLERDAAAQGVLERACTELGFFRIRGHGVAPERLAAVREQVRAFFQLPEPSKRAVERTRENPWGFYDRELTKRQRDAKEIFDFGPPDGAGPLRAEPQFPAELPGFESAMWDWYRVCEALSYRILAGIATTLGVPARALHGAFERGHTSFLRLNQYPPTPDPQALGVHRHTDAGALTVLLDDGRPGLEVQLGGRWVGVEPDPDLLLVNIGDVVQVWSNDRYPAPCHRVRASREAPRISAPFFFNPAYEAVYAPLDAPPRYRPINWGEFRAGRAAGDYSDLGAEIQISDFRISA